MVTSHYRGCILRDFFYFYKTEIKRQKVSDFLLIASTTYEYSETMSDEEQDLTNAQLLRFNAEKQLKVRQEMEEGPLTEIDAKRLLHELSVHQIELEMQNEELRRANETAEAALRKYTMLYDFAPMGCFTLDAEGIIEDLNFTGAEMLGERRFSLMGINFKLFVAEDSKVIFDNFLRKVYAGFSKESCEVKLGYYKSPLRSVYLEGIVTGDEKNCLLSVVDISNFRK